MARPNTLRVKPRAGIVTRYDLLDQGVKRMVGRRLEPNADAANGYAWVDTGEVVELPYMREFIDEIRDGGLWAVDEATARAVWGAEFRAHFDPSFGTAPTASSPVAEHHEITDAAHVAEEKV